MLETEPILESELAQFKSSCEELEKSEEMSGADIEKNQRPNASNQAISIHNSPLSSYPKDVGAIYLLVPMHEK